MHISMLPSLLLDSHHVIFYDSIHFALFLLYMFGGKASESDMYTCTNDRLASGRGLRRACQISNLWHKHLTPLVL